jgi:hypothetical protein
MWRCLDYEVSEAGWGRTRILATYSRMACPFKNALGVPGQGFHSMRFMGVAVGDTVGTIVLALLISRNFGLEFIPTLLFLFILGEVLHWYFGVDTAVLRFLGITDTC